VTFELKADVYRMQRRPQHAQLVLNDDYAGVRVVDAQAGDDVLRVAFPADFSGMIDAWCLRADGDELVACDGGGHAVHVSLRDGRARSLRQLPWTDVAGMPYDWRGETLWLGDPHSLRFATLTAGELREVDAFDALQANRAWRRAFDRLRRAGGGACRVDPERGELVYVAGERAGTIGWLEQSELSVAAPIASGGARIAAGDAARIGDRIALLGEYELVVVEADGAVAARTAAPDGFHFRCIDACGDELVVAAAALDSSRVRFMRV